MSIRQGKYIIASGDNGGGTGNPDERTIKINENNQLQAIGMTDSNKKGVVYDWVGTVAEYTEQRVETLHPDWLCFITDDYSEGLVLPDQVGHAGKYLSTDGNVLSWGEVDLTTRADTALSNLTSAGIKIIQDNAGSGAVVGDIVPSFAIERKGSLLCNGSVVKKSTYPKLFDVIQYKYGGSGDDFNLPDLRNYWLVGAGSDIVGLGDKVSAGLPNITGNFRPVGQSGDADGAFTVRSATGISGHAFITSDTQFDFNASRSSSIYGSSSTVRPQSFGVNFFIVY